METTRSIEKRMTDHIWYLDENNCKQLIKRDMDGGALNFRDGLLWADFKAIPISRILLIYTCKAEVYE